MENNLGFKNKNERNEFFIAIAVIVFFIWLFWGLGACNDWLSQGENKSELMSETLGADTDGDGVLDSLDHCPTVVGRAYNYGCPVTDSTHIDTDGDGIIDLEDACIEQYAKTENGCPMESENDKDGDGTPDESDECPEVAGPEERNGCPQDTDGDGVLDIYDNCPEDAGDAQNNGCPDVQAIPVPIPEENVELDTATISEDEAEVLQKAKYGVEFETASSKLKPESKKILDDIAAIMQKHPEAKLSIVGYTDSKGDDNYNLELSRNRAKACAEYLASDGVSAERISWNGMGESNPVAANDTQEGRAKNRRVEFVLE